jgi:hypothetical protein
MEKPTKRKKGGQKGNRNAVKHDFYSKVLDETERFDFINAADMDGIDEEIALLRTEIKKSISGGDDRNLLLLVKAVGALEKLIRTRYQISFAQRKGLKEAINNVIRDVLVPMGVSLGSAVITKRIPG